MAGCRLLVWVEWNEWGVCVGVVVCVAWWLFVERNPFALPVGPLPFAMRAIHSEGANPLLDAVVSTCHAARVVIHRVLSRWLVGQFPFHVRMDRIDKHRCLGESRVSCEKWSKR